MMRWISVLAVVIVVSGCGYALAGRGNTLPTSIRRIGVPTFQNLSTTPDLDRIFTEAVRAELQSRGSFTVVSDTTGVDAVLTASIVSVPPPVPMTFNATNQASQYTITVIARAEFKDLKDNKILYTNASLRHSEVYSVASGTAVNDLAALFTQDKNALDRLAKAFATKLVAEILEQF